MEDCRAFYLSHTDVIWLFDVILDSTEYSELVRLVHSGYYRNLFSLGLF